MPSLTLPGGSAPSYTTSWFGDAGTVSSVFTAPTVRAMANGVRNLRTTSMTLFTRGESGARSARAMIANNLGSAVAIAENSQALSVSLPIELQMVSGGSFTYGFNVNGGAYFGGSGASGKSIVHSSQGTLYSGRALSGTLYYIQAPAAPSARAVLQSDVSATSVTFKFDGSSDTGGGPITGWTAQRATNASFTTGVVSVASTGTTTFTGLTPGTTYYFRAAARNEVTDAAGTTGPWSNVVSATTFAGVYWYNHTSAEWEDAEVWWSDGANFQPATALWSTGSPFDPAG